MDARKLIGGLLAAALLVGCGSAKKDTTLRIVATTGMLGDAVAHVVDTLHTVQTIMGPGTDPHLYKPTNGDLKLLREADVIIYTGHHLEGKMADVLHKLSREKVTLAVAEVVDQSRIIKGEEEDSHDPHIWFDVDLWSEAVGHIGQALQAADTANAFAMAANTRAYQQELSDLHMWAKSMVGTIPDSQRVLITAHDAFSYFGAAYDVEVRGLQGLSTTSSFGVSDVVALRDYIVDRKIKAVFVETSVPHRSIEAVVEGCQAEGHNVIIGGDLYSDAMGAPGSGADTYVDMVKTNVTTIVEGLK